MAREAMDSGMTENPGGHDMDDSDEKTSHIMSARSSDIKSVHLEPPPQIRKPKRHFYKSMKLKKAPWGFISPSRWSGQTICARSKFCPPPPPSTPVRTLRILPDDADPEDPPQFSGFRPKPKSKGWDGNPYIIVGIMSQHHPVPRERLLEVTKPEGLFKQIRAGTRQVRPFWRSICSFKKVAGFSMYECNPVKGSHNLVAMDHQTELILTELFRDYESGEPDYADRWLKWMQSEFNLNKENPADGKYALQLVLRWSPSKIVLYGSCSIILAFVVGFWYQFTDHGIRDPAPSDRVAITQTAWTISSFILTAAGVAVALLASITQTSDVS